MRKYIGWPILFVLIGVVRNDFHVIPILAGLVIFIATYSAGMWYRKRNATRREK